MANESYEDFARALQTEYEEDCGVTFGKVPLTALAKLIRVVDGEEQPIGRDAAEVIRDGTGRAEDARRRRAHSAGLRSQAARTSSSTCPRRIRSWRRPWSTCCRPTRSSGTSAGSGTKGRTG